MTDKPIWYDAAQAMIAQAKQTTTPRSAGAHPALGAPYYKEPVVENTVNEQLWTVADASKWLPGPQVGLDVLRTLGADASRCARIWKRPTGTKPTPHQPWPSEKTYPIDVLREVFRLNPATRDAYAQLVAKQGAK